MIERVMILLRKIDLYFSKYILRKKLIVRKVLNNKMYLDLVTDGISHSLAIHRIREADMTQIIEKYVTKGMNILDVGSNIGYYPLLEASILKESGKIYSFEPDPRNYRILLKNITLNEYDAIITPFNLAVFNKEGEEEMLLAEASNLSKLSSTDDDNFLSKHKIERTYKVKTTTVDKFLSDKDFTPDFVRMDVEGNEVEIFQGMKNTLLNASGGFRILLELHPHSYSKDHDFGNELTKLFDTGFTTELIISAGEPKPKKFVEFGYSPAFEIKSDGFVRGWYDNIPNKDAIELTCYEPKVSRYILLKKN
ncbi:FkbM family methyltransferase [Candidatus Marinimicrobia bacterium MT.SAG.3]|nr:FkbM family methyltransferase [Candidatus Marinimicrobia bacterium MT.SAG.3]